MRSRHAKHRVTPLHAAVLAVAMLSAAAVTAEPRERWPGSDAGPRLPGEMRSDKPPDLLADLLPGDCNGARLGAIAGAAIGGVLGARIGDGDRSALAAVAGTLIGALIGGGIGQGIDDGDERCAGRLPPAREGVISATGEHSA